MHTVYIRTMSVPFVSSWTLTSIHKRVYIQYMVSFLFKVELTSRYESVDWMIPSIPVSKIGHTMKKVIVISYQTFRCADSSTFVSISKKTV